MRAGYLVLGAAMVCLVNNSPVPDVAQTEAARVQALLDNDIAALRALTGDDFVHVDSNGRMRNKTDFISEREAGGRPFSLFVNEETEIRHYGDTAIVFGRYRNAHEGTDAADAKRARFIRVYVLRDGRWQNVFHQATEIASQP